MQPCIYSVQQRRKARGPPANSRQFTIPPTYLAQLPSERVEEPTSLGVLDSLFAQDSRRPTLVELLVVVPCALDAPRLGEAVQHAQRDSNGGFAVVGGVRKAVAYDCNGSASIIPGPGVRFSACSVDHAQLLSRPPSPPLFDNPTEDAKNNNSNGDEDHGSCSRNDPPVVASSSPEAKGSHGNGTGVLTLRVSHGRSGQLTGLGVTFDHALCDVSGVALFLAHVSAHYVAPSNHSDAALTQGRSLPPQLSLPPQPVNDRALQAVIAQKGIPAAAASTPATDGAATRAAKEEEAILAPNAASETRRTSSRTGGLKGGCGCVEWRYRASDLAALKGAYKAHTRHDAAFTDVILVLREAYAEEAKTAAVNAELSTELDTVQAVCVGWEPRQLNSATVSRDERVRCGLPAELFGNGISLVQAILPPGPNFTETNKEGATTRGEDSCEASAAGSDAASHEANTTNEVEGKGLRLPSVGEAVACSLREAIAHGVGLPPDWPHFADVHLNTWWHPLQHRSAPRIAPADEESSSPSSSSSASSHTTTGYWFGAPGPPSFAVGPGSIAAAASMCQARGGQPNVTLLPWPDSDGAENNQGGGFVVSLVAPLQTSHAVLKLLRAREKKAKRERKISSHQVVAASAPPRSSSLQDLAAETPTTASAGAPTARTTANLSVMAGASGASSDAPPSTSVTKSANAENAPTCAVVWLHGLGDASQSWGKRLSAAHPELAAALQDRESDSSTSCVFVQPLAPLLPVEAMGGASCHAWFDLPHLPVTSANLSVKSEAQLQEAVSMVHQELEALQRRGIAPECIVLGGFSQVTLLLHLWWY